MTQKQYTFTGPEACLLPALKQEVKEADEIKIIVSFLMTSGIKLLIESFDSAVRAGVPVKILTGTYLSITEPDALCLLRKEFKDKIDIRLYDNKHKSFHPKAYILKKSNNEDVLFIGSSNISNSALIQGIEWNYRLERKENPTAFDEFDKTFDDIYKNNSIELTDKVLKEYEINWKKPKLINENMAVIESDEQDISPRGVQIEALYELEKFRENGEKRGLVVAATGVGKTYLAAFDAKNFNRILFVAHREEIIKQAEKSFKKVCPNKTSGFFYSEEKTQDADMIFALVNTIGRKENLELFDIEYFDYIVIDEFHHAAADSYKNLLEYFKPKFLLGLTATPARMDNRDILKLCDYNIPYEINLKSAINRGILVPFRYCGIYDATDYSEIKIVNGKYNESQLGQALSNGNRAELILKNYQKYELSPALGFCSNIEHCDYMAEYFNEHGIKSCSVHSGNSNGKYCMKRDEAIQKLKSGEIKVLFSVDIFNEGVDIPEIRLVMFLRPTESYNVFMQQLGRGLRKFEGKEYLIVLDFIGNYLKANYKPHLLTGNSPYTQNFKKALPEEEELPDDCIMDYDFRIIDLFKEMNKKEPLELRLKINYIDIKKKLGRRPTREDMFEESDIPLKTYTNKYKSWLKWLETVEDLRTEEKEWIGTDVEEFLESLEKTSMSKSYKIPTILAFFRGKNICNKVTLEEVAATHMDFYLNSTSNMQDLCDERHKNILAWTINDYMKNAKNNPIKYLTNSNKFFNYDETTNTFYLNLDIDKINQSLLYEHVMDILGFRKKDYFSKRYGE